MLRGGRDWLCLHHGSLGRVTRLSSLRRRRTRRSESSGVSKQGSHMDDEWELRWVRVPQGTHLSNSRATPGRERDLLREDGTNKTLGPTESIAADEDAFFGVRSHGSNSPSGSGGTERTWAQQLAVGVITDVVKAVDWEAVFEQFVAPVFKRQSAKVGTHVRSAVGRIESAGDVAPTRLLSLRRRSPTSWTRQTTVPVSA